SRAGHPQGRHDHCRVPHLPLLLRRTNMPIDHLVILAVLAGEPTEAADAASAPAPRADASIGASNSHPGATGDADSTTAGSATADSADESGEARFITRHRPRSNELVLGAFAGIL